MTFTETLVQPLNQTGWDYLGKESSRLTSLYPLSFFGNGINNAYSTWEDESFELAKTYVYAGIKESSTPSAEYMAQGVKISEQQVVKAGYRIALLLEQWWGATTVEEPVQELFL